MESEKSKEKFYKYRGFSLFFIENNRTNINKIYNPEKVAICSIVNPLSIRKPNNAVPNAVENTNNADVIALIPPINLTP